MVKFLGTNYHVHYNDLILRVLDRIVTFIWCVSFTAVVLTCSVMKGGVCMCGCMLVWLFW
jgi:hypothetical protein